jgi:hypothetical protein
MPEHVHTEKCIVIEAGRSHPDVDGIPMEKMTPRQLHRYVEYYNWDGPQAPMWRVIGHAKCDLGTALMVFWLCEPEFFHELLARGEKLEKYMIGGFKLMRSVMARVRRGQYRRAQFSFNPRRFMLNPGKCMELGIPDFMCMPVQKGRMDPRVHGVSSDKGERRKSPVRSSASRKKARK